MFRNARALMAVVGKREFQCGVSACSEIQVVGGIDECEVSAVPFDFIPQIGQDGLMNVQLGLVNDQNRPSLNE